MALAWTTDIQSRVALMVCGKTYSECPSAFRALLDGDGSVGGDPSGGVARDAFRTVAGYAQWFELCGAGVAGDAAEAYLIAECAYRMSMTHNVEKVAVFERLLERSREDYFSSVTRLDIGAGFDQGVSQLTLRDLRYHVVSAAIRRRPRVFPAAETIDAAAVYVTTRIWNACRWLSKSRLVRGTILTDGSVQFDDWPGEDFEDFATSTLYLQQDEDGNPVRGSIELANQEMMSELAARHPDDTGQPMVFRMYRDGDSVLWQFHPTPDKNYVFTCEVGVAGPGAPASAGSTGPFLRFPESFHALIREWTLAKTFSDHGIAEGFAKARACEDELARMAVSYDDRGMPDTIEPQRPSPFGSDMYFDGYFLGGAL